MLAHYPSWGSGTFSSGRRQVGDFAPTSLPLMGIRNSGMTTGPARLKRAGKIPHYPSWGSGTTSAGMSAWAYWRQELTTPHGDQEQRLVVAFERVD